MLNPADLDQLATALRDAGVRSVDYDPAQVHAPGIWLRLDTLTPATMDGGVEVGLTMFPVVAATGTTRSLGALSELLDLALPVLQAWASGYGAATVTGLALPGSSAPLPALSLPFTLHTIPE